MIGKSLGLGILAVWLTLPLRAEPNWELTLAADATGAKLTTISKTKPFALLVTNKTNHAMSLPRYSNELGEYDKVSFNFINAKGEEIPVEIFGAPDAQTTCTPEAIAPGRSFVITVNLTHGNWNTMGLAGPMKVTAYFENQLAAIKTAGVSSLWVGELKSDTVPVTVEP